MGRAWNTWAGRGEEKKGRAQKNMRVFDLFKQISASSKCFDQRWTYKAQKIPNKTWMERA
jgi:hypothetical protein